MNCVICHGPIKDDSCWQAKEWHRTGNSWCFHCSQSKVRPVQKVREQQKFNAKDRINEIYAEMRAAITERDKWRREASKAKSDCEKIRTEIEKEFLAEWMKQEV